MTQLERCLRAIRRGYRTSREVAVSTGLRRGKCGKHLHTLRKQGLIEHTGYLRYPAEALAFQFYEPITRTTHRKSEIIKTERLNGGSLQGVGSVVRSSAVENGK